MNKEKNRHLGRILFLVGLVLIVSFAMNFISASISGTVFEIRETPGEDLNIPFENITVKFYAVNGEIYEALTNDDGKFYLGTKKIFSGTEHPDFYFDSLQIWDGEEIITETNVDNNFTSNPDVGMIINLNNREALAKSSSSSGIQSMTESYTVGVDYPSSLIYLPTGYSKTPVLLVHGWGNVADSDASDWGSLKSEVDKDYDVFRLQYWPANLDNRKNAGVVSSAISTTLSFYPSSNKLNVISHSMGGLAVRGYIQDMGISSSGYSRYYQNNMNKYVIIASPMYGSYFANIIDGITEIDIRKDHPICQEFIDGKDLVAYFDGDPLYGHTEATLDMEMGSDFTWELNNQEINKNIDYLTISGKHTAVGTLINSNKQYCAGNFLETNDGVVSLINSNLVKENIPSIVLDDFHSGSFLDLLDGINKDRNAGKLTNLYFGGNLNSVTVEDILTSSSGELFYDPQIDPFNKMPEELKTQGSVLLQFNASEISINDIDLKEYFGIEIYQLENNPNTHRKDGRWFYVDVDESPGTKIDFTTMMPIGSYNVIFNNNLGHSAIDIVNIKPGEVTMMEIDLDRDDDDFDYLMVGGTDCNDLNSNINPLENEFCNNVDDDCNSSSIDGLDEKWFMQNTSCGIGECYSEGLYLCTNGNQNDTCISKEPQPENCTDELDNDCDGLTDLNDTESCHVECFTDEDCGNSTTSKYCAENGNACEFSVDYTCNNPGTTESLCASSSGGGCWSCPFGCSEGACLDCQPNWINTTWTDWENQECTNLDLINKSRTRLQYDADNCESSENQTFVDNLLNETCDYCTPNIIERGNCLENDTLIREYELNDTCYLLTGLSSDNNLSVPNLTSTDYGCDYDSNGIIGDLNLVGGIGLFINNSDDLNQTFNNTQKVEFKEGNKTILEFNFTFHREEYSVSFFEKVLNFLFSDSDTQTEDPSSSSNSSSSGGGGLTSLNLARIFIEGPENKSNSTYDYLIVKGINLTSQNNTKTIYIDRILNGTGLCIKDAEITNISEISANCQGENEFSIKCPGVNGDYSCTLIENDSRYMITGLKHSGVMEINGFCGDSVVNNGETCSSCPADVGACQTIDPPGGGGGGGGGTPTPKTNETNNNSLSFSTSNADTTSSGNEDQNPFTNQTETSGFFSRITGAVVGTAGKGSFWVIAFIVVIFGVVSVMQLRKNRKFKEKIRPIVAKYNWLKKR